MSSTGYARRAAALVEDSIRRAERTTTMTIVTAQDYRNARRIARNPHDHRRTDVETARNALYYLKPADRDRLAAEAEALHRSTVEPYGAGWIARCARCGTLPSATFDKRRAEDTAADHERV